MRRSDYNWLLWPSLISLTLVIIVALLTLLEINWMAGILVPIVIAILIAIFVQRLPQILKPVAVTAKVKDVDFMIYDNATVPASGHTVHITVEANGTLTVLLDRLRAVVVSRGPPGGHLSPHLGVVESRPFELLLDYDPPVLRPIPRADGSVIEFPFKVSPGDPEVFDLTVYTETADVQWYIELETVCLGVRRTIRIDLAGRPFRTMARQ